METWSSTIESKVHENAGQENAIFVEANVTNISAKIQSINRRGVDKNYMLGRGLLKENFYTTLVKMFAMNANFHFTHCKSMETLSCHNNQITWATAMKNNICVEANVINNSAKFLPPHSFWHYWKNFVKLSTMK